MKILDTYIIKKFFGTFILSISLIILIIIVFDISEKLEDFKAVSLNSIVFDYYFNFIPYYANLFSPLFTFIAVIFFTSRMASRTEIVAILSSGISYRRLLFPYLLTSSFIAALSLLLNHFIIPHSTKKRIAFEDMYVGSQFYNSTRNIHIQIEPGTYIYMYQYFVDNNVGSNFSIEKFNGGDLYYKLVADEIRWDSINHSWTINNYYIRKINGMNESIIRGAKIDTVLALSPKDFERKDNKIDTKDYHELNEFIASEKLKGAPNIETFEIEKYRRTAFPFATIILTIIGVSIASRKIRGGIGMHIAIGLAIGFGYILFLQISTKFAAGGMISPVLGVWIPNILFSFVAAYLLKIAQK